MDILKKCRLRKENKTKNNTNGMASSSKNRYSIGKPTHYRSLPPSRGTSRSSQQLLLGGRYSLPRTAHGTRRFLRLAVRWVSRKRKKATVKHLPFRSFRREKPLKKQTVQLFSILKTLAFRALMEPMAPIWPDCSFSKYLSHRGAIFAAGKAFVTRFPHRWDLKDN